MHWQSPDTNARDAGWVTTRTAAAALGIKPRRVRDFISEGMLEARTEGEGPNRRYFVSVAGVEALREELHAEGKLPGQDLELPVEAGERTAELLRELTAKISEARYQLGRAEARLEMTVRSESALQEQLQYERERSARLETDRDRLLQDLLRERDSTTAERERAEHFEAELRSALEVRRGWFRRFFGF